MKIAILACILVIFELTAYADGINTSSHDLLINGLTRTVVLIGTVQLNKITKIYTVKVNRVLYGLVDNIDHIYQLDVSPQYINAIPDGLYCLMLEINGNNLRFGYFNITLGPIKNFLSLTSMTDSKIEDMVLILDTEQIGIPEMKYRRLAGFLQDKDIHPLVEQYAMIAQQQLLFSCISGYHNSLLSIVVNYDDYSIDTVIAADKSLLSTEASCLAVAKTRSWHNSQERMLMLESIKNRIDKNNDNWGYIENELEHNKNVPNVSK